MIELTQEQKDAYLKEKTAKFIEGLKQLEKDTNMTVVARLQATNTGIFPSLAIVPITIDEKINPK